jgi:hypothetical protein
MTDSSPRSFRAHLLARVGVDRLAAPDHGLFDPASLPHRWWDRSKRDVARAFGVAGLIAAILGLIIVLEARLGPTPEIGVPVEVWLAALIALLLLAAALWLNVYEDRVEIHPDEVRVWEHRLFGQRRWREPLSAYALRLRRVTLAWDDPEQEYETWSIALAHPQASRSVLLYARTLSAIDMKVLDHRRLPVDDDPQRCEERARHLAQRWAEALNLELVLELDG